jgi:hypothetical protein
MKKYYLHNGTEQDGPFNIAELTAKNIKKDTEIWHEGLSDWTTAEKVDELKELFKLTSPPPIKKREASTPPPVNKQKTEETAVPKKKTTSWKNVFKKIAITCVAIFAVLVIYKKMNSGSGNSSSRSTYYEKIMSIEETEQSQPTVFLKASGNYNENFWGDKIKVHGKITNSATVATFKDAVVRVTYYSKTKTVLGSNEYTIYEIFPPNSVKNFELKIQNYKDVNTIGWDVIKASVKYKY